MTNDRMARGYLTLAAVRADALEVFFDAGSWANVVREAQEAVELFLKAALRHAGIEPARIHDVGAILAENASRFPGWFAERIPELASISVELVAERGASYYGDERRGIPPDRLFERSDAERAMEHAALVRGLCERLVGPAGP
jgi:HEPN domain-containing protein